MTLCEPEYVTINANIFESEIFQNWSFPFKFIIRRIKKLNNTSESTKKLQLKKKKKGIINYG